MNILINLKIWKMKGSLRLEEYFVGISCNINGLLVVLANNIGMGEDRGSNSKISSKGKFGDQK